KMASTSGEISFLVDIMIVETLLSDTGLSKTAQAGGMLTEIIDKVKNYFVNQIDPAHPAASVLNMLAPGVVSTTFARFGFGWLGILLGICMRVFHINVSGILSSIYDKIKDALSGGKKMTSSQIDGIVNSAVQEHDKPATEEDAA